MVVCDHICNDRLLVWLVDKHVLSVQEFDEPELLLGEIKGVIEVVHSVALG